jgi:hypothetical protein
MVNAGAGEPTSYADLAEISGPATGIGAAIASSHIATTSNEKNIVNFFKEPSLKLSIFQDTPANQVWQSSKPVLFSEILW